MSSGTGVPVYSDKTDVNVKKLHIISPVVLFTVIRYNHDETYIYNSKIENRVVM